MYMVFRGIQFFLILAFLSINTAQAKEAICPVTTNHDCAGYLRNYPLFDTEYKIAANYVPVLPLRALAHADVYKEKKSFHIERFYYVSNLVGDLGKAYQTVILDGEIGGFGIFNRKIKAKGKLNEFDLEYENHMSFALPRTAHMKITAKLDDIQFLEMKVRSDGNEMTNDAEGVFFGKEVKYHTHWRDTEGILSGVNYKIHAEGVQKEEGEFSVILQGKAGEHSITGSGKLITDNKYETIEKYGPITVKTFITIKN